MILLGDKLEVGVELKLLTGKPNRGFARVWFGGHFLSTIFDEIYIKSYLLNLLDGVCHCEEISDLNEDILVSDVRLFNYLKKSINEAPFNAEKYLLRGSTFTDCFMIFCFKRKGIIHLIWRSRKSFDFADVLKQGNAIFSYSIDEKYFYEHFKKIKKEITRLVDI
jgi:hypothetical protein